MKHIRTAALPLLATLVLALAGCGSKVSQKNFDRITDGMSMAQVVDILGKPTKSDSVSIAGLSGTAAVWRDAHREIDIKFVNGKVRIKDFTRR